MRTRRVAGALLVAAVAAVAAGAPALVRPAAAELPPSCATPSDQPGAVRLTVLRLEPHTIRPADTVQVLALLQNCGTAPLTGIRVRLRTGEELFTRTQLAQADGQPLTERAGGDWLDLPAPLSVGAAAQVRYETTVAALRLTAIGVYPAEFVVKIGDGRQVGAVRTYLPFFPDGVARPTEVSWLLPFADRPHRLYDGAADAAAVDGRVLIDDRLARLLEGNGRLNRMLTTAERADAAGIPFAIAVDPDLIDTVHGMTLGYQVQAAARATVEGAGKQAATVWLNRLIGLTGRHQVIALPYADADLIALTGNGLTELAQTRRETLQTLGQQLHAVVSTQVAWPAGGLLTDRALDAVVTQGAQVVVLDAAALPNTNAEPSGRTGSAASPLPSASGNAVALVTDTGLQRVVTGAVRVAGGQRLVEQRYLAELAMITAEAPSVQRRILVAPPHDWSPLPDAAAGMLRDTRDVGWLTPGSVAELARSTELVNRGALVYPRGAPELPADQAGRIRKLQELVDQFRSALDNIAENQLLERYTHALQRAASAAWRTTPGAAAGSIAAPPDLTGAMFLAPIASRITTVVTKQVYIVRPQDGKYSLASQNSLLPLTVVNNLDVRVHVRVRISAQGMVGFQAQEVDATLEGGKRTLVRIPATVTQSGRFRVTAVLLTPDGKKLNAEVPLNVQSTAYGAVALGITGAAFGLLLLLLARRVVQRIRSGPAAPVPAGSPGERAT